MIVLVSQIFGQALIESRCDIFKYYGIVKGSLRVLKETFLGNGGLFPGIWGLFVGVFRGICVF